jgi:cell division septum initiation protein DivIVA
MNKSEEIQRYDEFVASLPENSYLRPWLAGIREQVAADIRNDIFPSSTPRESYENAENIRKEARETARTSIDLAKAEAERILDAAHKRAKEMQDYAESQAEATRQSLRDDIYRLRNALSNVA